MRQWVLSCAAVMAMSAASSATAAEGTVCLAGCGRAEASAALCEAGCLDGTPAQLRVSPVFKADAVALKPEPFVLKPTVKPQHSATSPVLLHGNLSPLKY